MKLQFAVILTICLGLLLPIQAQERPSKKAATKIEKNFKSFDFGLELRQYKYVEPGFVEHNGLLYGVWGEWLWQSAMGSGRTYGNLLFGALSYEGALCDNSNNCTPYSASTNDIIAKGATRLEFNVTSGLNLFAGLGGRYLYDKGEGVGFYQRIGTWLFLPVGVNYGFDTSLGKIILDAEYDLIFYGSFRSNLSAVSSSFKDLTHTQSGHGLALSSTLQLEDYSLGAYYELWDLNESNTLESNGLFFIEPKNNSQSFGLKVGLKF